MQLAQGAAHGENSGAGPRGRDSGAMSLDGHGEGGTSFPRRVNSARPNSDEEDLGERQE